MYVTNKIVSKIVQALYARVVTDSLRIRCLSFSYSKIVRIGNFFGLTILCIISSLCLITKSP